MARAVVVAEDRWEKRKHFAPREERQHQRHGEPRPGQTANRQDEKQTYRLQRERDSHRQLSADPIRRPPPENPAGAVGERVERRGDRKGARCNPPRLRDRSGIRCDEQAAGRHHDEGDVHHVKLRRPQHLGCRELMPAQPRRSHRRRRCGARFHRLRWRMTEELRHDQNRQSLNATGPEKRRPVPVVSNRPRNERDEERSAAPKSRRHNPGRQAATLLEPFER